MDSDVRVCPFCGQRPGAGMFCDACGSNLAEVERLPTRAQWEATEAADRTAPEAGPPPHELAARCAAACEAFLAAMHAAGDPGATRLFAGGLTLFRQRRPSGWVLRPVHREPGELHEYEPGLVLTTEGRFHRLESEVRGWGQRSFPQFHDTAAPDPIEMPVQERLIGELDAVLRANGVAAR